MASRLEVGPGGQRTGQILMFFGNPEGKEFLSDAFASLSAGGRTGPEDGWASSSVSQ